jgi:hypothetical protein
LRPTGFIEVSLIEWFDIGVTPKEDMLPALPTCGQTSGNIDIVAGCTYTSGSTNILKIPY